MMVVMRMLISLISAHHKKASAGQELLSVRDTLNDTDNDHDDYDDDAQVLSYEFSEYASQQL
jgi:hypothetical protein